MTKLQNLEAQYAQLCIDYTVQEQVYINNYYYCHDRAMIAYELMQELKTAKQVIQTEFIWMNTSWAPKLWH